MTKLCKSCGIEKSLNCFYKEKKNKDGLKGVCIDCFKQSRKTHESIKRSNFSSLYLDPSFMSELKTCISCDVEKLEPILIKAFNIKTAILLTVKIALPKGSVKID